MTNPLVHPETPQLAVASFNAVGEGVLWDHRLNRVLWVDIKNPAVWWYEPESGKSGNLPLDERIGFIALTPDHDIVIAGFKSGLARLHLWGGERQPLVAPEPDRPGNRINDGTVGPDGAVYFGTMDDAEADGEGRFYRYDGQTLAPFGGSAVITNGPALSADGQTLYTVDTRAGFLYAHDLDGGTVGEARRFARFEEGWGHPDGLAVDAQNHVWSCHWGAARITRFAPDGSVERVLPVPTGQVTKCAFGGPAMTTLFITTAGIGRDPSIEPMAGNLFMVETGIRGQQSQIATV